MAQSREDVVANLISLGKEVTWQAWHFGAPLQIMSRITETEALGYRRRAGQAPGTSMSSARIRRPP